MSQAFSILYYLFWKSNKCVMCVVHLCIDIQSKNSMQKESCRTLLTAYIVIDLINQNG